MSIPVPVKTRTAVVQDAKFWGHFRHLAADLPARQHGVPWHVEYATLSITDLLCPYPTPGEQEAPPAGLMGSVGWPAGACEGKRITEMVAAIQRGIEQITADLSNPALKRVLDYRDRGRLFIVSRAQPLAFMVHNNAWIVREGVHRTIAMA